MRERYFFMFRTLQNIVTGFFYKQHINMQHQAETWFKLQSHVLKGAKRKINIVNETLAE